MPNYYGNYEVNSEDFFVKNFSFNSDKFYSWENEFTPNGKPKGPITLSNGNKLEFAPMDGIAGQGNTNPRSTFENHAIVKYDGKYYDPSYGSEGGKSKNEWETMSLEGFGTGGGYTWNLFFMKRLNTRQLCWLKEINNSTLQCNITP